jgi:hypothetical protein
MRYFPGEYENDYDGEKPRVVIENEAEEIIDLYDKEQGVTITWGEPQASQEEEISMTQGEEAESENNTENNEESARENFENAGENRERTPSPVAGPSWWVPVMQQKPA